MIRLNTALAAALLVLTTACTININLNVPPTPTRPATGTSVQVNAPTPQNPALTVQPSQNPQGPVGERLTPNAPTIAPTAPPAVSGAGPAIAGCPIFPPDHIWNTRVDTLPVDPNSDAYVTAIGREVGLHPDFGSGVWAGGRIGIPYNVVDGSAPKVSLDFDYADESDPGPYPIPAEPDIEDGSDHHVLIVDSSTCTLYEIYAAERDGASWRAGSGAIWDLRGYALRPDTWTSADAAGLPILPGLVRYEEVAAGKIRHAIRFTAENVRSEFIWPAKHQASESSDSDLAPYGQRFRLKASFDISPYPPEVQVILQAMKTYGLILADNGNDWYITGAPDQRWNNDELVPLLREVTGDNFEAVDVSGLMIDPGSGQARQP